MARPPVVFGCLMAVACVAGATLLTGCDPGVDPGMGSAAGGAAGSLDPPGRPVHVPHPPGGTGGGQGPFPVPPPAGGIGGLHPAGSIRLSFLPEPASSYANVPAMLVDIGLSLLRIDLKNDSPNSMDHPALGDQHVRFSDAGPSTVLFEGPPVGTYSEIKLSLGPSFSDSGVRVPALQVRANVQEGPPLTPGRLLTSDEMGPGSAVAVTIRCRPGTYHARGAMTPLVLTLRVGRLLAIIAAAEVDSGEAPPLPNNGMVLDLRNRGLRRHVMDELAKPASWVCN